MDLDGERRCRGASETRYCVVDGLLIAEDLIDAVLGEGARERSTASVSGADLVGVRYRRPLDLVAPPEGADAWRVVAATWVTAQEGTDSSISRQRSEPTTRATSQREGLPTINQVGPDGHFHHAGFLNGQHAKSVESIDQARENLNREIPDWDFDAASARLRKLWNDKLGVFSLEGASEDQEKIFYTGLYHALLYPRLFSEYGHYYSAFDDTVHAGVSYTAFSIWDIFRAEHSLLTLAAPEKNGDMITALLQNYKEGGWLPKWPNPSYTNIMIGTHADSLIAESINKGFHGFDYQLAYEAVYKDAMTPPDGDTTRRWFDEEPNTPYEARAGLTYSKQLGYIPDDKTAESASSTLEEAYDDWCVAQVAKALGKTKDYEFFLRRSLNYKLLFNPATGFMQARNSDGSWADPSFGWTEGNKWVYTWAVLHDIPGLLRLMGGADKFNAQLDEHFRGGHNQHDNEPSHHYGYLYDYSGQPWKTQAKVREIAAKFYANDPGGIAGDDDCGQMSAWYIFTALGFYPLNPASGDYLIGSPLYGKIVFNLPSRKTFIVTAVDNSEQNVYIQSVKLNGVPLKIPVVRYTDIVNGGKLEFVMGPAPSRWAADWNPPALADSLPK